MQDPILELNLVTSENPEGEKFSTGDLGEVQPLENGEGDDSKNIQYQEVITLEVAPHSLGTDTPKIPEPAKTGGNETLQKALVEGLTKEGGIAKKDSTKDIAGEEPSGSSKGWVSWSKQLWESEKEKSKRLQTEVNELRAEMKKKNQEMSRQKRDHKTTSENHDKLAKKYKDSGKECDKLRDDIAKLRRENTKLRNDLSASEKTNHNLNGHLKIVEGDNRRLREENGKLEKGNAVLKGELNEEKLHTEYLDGQILERDKQIAKSHGDAVKNLTQTVSSSMTDNQIAKELTSFFDNCYEEWAMDHCVDHLEDTKEIEMHLLKGNLLLQDPAAPPEFQFDLEDSTAPAIVLQTYLSQALCQAFFKSPYFLIALGGERPIKDETWDGRGLSRIEHWEGDNSQDGLQWRVKTVERLERMFSLGEIPFRAMAESFCTTYRHLLKSPDENVVHELEEIFSECAKLALRIWKAKKKIGVYGPERFSSDPRRRFMNSSPETKPDPAVQLAVRDPRLDGRPICMVVTPLICAYFQPEKAKALEQVVWSKAIVWISNKTFELPQYRHGMDWSY